MTVRSVGRDTIRLIMAQSALAVPLPANRRSRRKSRKGERLNRNLLTCTCVLLLFKWPLPIPKFEELCLVQKSILNAQRVPHFPTNILPTLSPLGMISSVCAPNRLERVCGKLFYVHHFNFLSTAANLFLACTSCFCICWQRSNAKQD